MKNSKKLLDVLRNKIRIKYYSIRKEDAYVYWVRDFILFHKNKSGKFRHPADMGMPEVNDFLTYLAVEHKVSASTQNHALNAIIFLYKNVVGKSFTIHLSRIYMKPVTISERCRSCLGIRM